MVMLTLSQERVTRTTVSQSTDAAEGGLDGMMQAIVCGEQIGWRQQARKIIIYTTEAKFHMAGDGLVSAVQYCDVSVMVIKCGWVW